MKKKVIAIIVVVLVVAACAGTAAFIFTRKDKGESDEVVYVESVAELTGSGTVTNNRYMGVVESQETKGVNKDSDKTVKEIFVEVGDEVKEGDALFEYDSDEMNLKLKQLELELTSINTSIATANQQITSLAAERDQVEADYKMEYTAQIQSLQAQINQYNYDASAKQLEIDRQTQAIENSTVYAPMDGIVKEINEDASGTDSSESSDSTDTDNSFISIMALGDYRIKGTASELNVASMVEGQSVVIRSRLDESVTWTGTITTVDLEHPDTSNSSYYYYSDSGTSTTKYPFYITLDSIDGLILGQHVYIEMDYGQGETKEGIWLYDSYIVMGDDGGACVWAEDKDGRIERREVTLGEYDEDNMQYEITDGLTTDDYIAWPEDRISEGMKTTTNYEDVLQYENTDVETDDGIIYEEDEGVETIDDEYDGADVIGGEDTEGAEAQLEDEAEELNEEIMELDEEVQSDASEDSGSADSGEEASE